MSATKEATHWSRVLEHFQLFDAPFFYTWVTKFKVVTCWIDSLNCLRNPAILAITIEIQINEQDFSIPQARELSQIARMTPL